jgi:hypothetical protein
MAHDDDLEMWDDDPLVRALRAPGSSAELAGEDDALAAFRAAVPRRSRRRLARRMGTGAGTLAVAVALSGGVAAAYTHTLPDPVQRVAHSWFGDIGVGPPPAARAAARAAPAHRFRPQAGHGAGSPVAPVGPGSPVAPVGPVGPVAGRTAAPTVQRSSPNLAVSPGASARPATKSTPRPAGQPSRSAQPTAPAEPTPVASPTPSPTPSSPSPPRLVPAAVSGTVSAGRVPAQASVTLSGRLTTRSGAAVPDRRVIAQWRPAGQHQRWSPIGSARTDSAGNVAFTTPALSRSMRLRLKAPHRVHSLVSTVVVVPTVEASISRNGRNYDVTINSSGLQPGDTVVVARRLRGHRTVVGRVSVDGSGAARLTIAVPKRKDVTFHVRTRRTVSHAAAATTFVAPRR